MVELEPLSERRRRVHRRGFPRSVRGVFDTARRGTCSGCDVGRLRDCLAGWFAKVKTLSRDIQLNEQTREVCRYTSGSVSLVLCVQLMLVLLALYIQALVFLAAQ
jgi:hypothetical protein